MNYKTTQNNQTDQQHQTRQQQTQQQQNHRQEAQQKNISLNLEASEIETPKGAPKLKDGQMRYKTTISTKYPVDKNAFNAIKLFDELNRNFESDLVNLGRLVGPLNAYISDRNDKEIIITGRNANDMKKFESGKWLDDLFDSADILDIIVEQNPDDIDPALKLIGKSFKKSVRYVRYIE